MFRNNNLQITYMKFSTLERWVQAVLRKEFGYDYEVWTNPIIWKNLIGLTIDETEMSDESFAALRTKLDATCFQHSEYLLTEIFELSRKRQKRRASYVYKFFVDDFKGFYLIRERVKTIQEG